MSVGSLLLRPPSVAEAADALAMLRDPLTALWNPASRVVDEATAAAWCASLGDWGPGDHATFSVLDAATERLLGNVSVHNVDREQGTAEIGYRVAPWARGRGVGTAAVRAVSDWAFGGLGLHRIQLFHAVANPASCRVATVAGYRWEGTLRESTSYGDGLRHDEHLHARLVGDAVSE
ncbi:GNAT family N-acetyltransferase [Solihabitans fulvus]|uniref:GNAT family N-acetyltransferase n=1 Tax=Solihabitans fulvus TaxID=1892852 RepID=A0A5B2WT04_9PSEU|nr:GNAT family N-acetyltransferase [Solihabitans fulvus]